MALWTAVVTLVLGVVSFAAADPSTVLVGAAEIIAVLGMFALICAAEALN
jgi:hypothetical protein